MYICICTCTQICIYVYIYICVYVYMNIYSYTHIHIEHLRHIIDAASTRSTREHTTTGYIHTYIHMCMYVYIHTYSVYTHIQLYIYVCIYSYIFPHKYIHVHIIHTCVTLFSRRVTAKSERTRLLGSASASLAFRNSASSRASSRVRIFTNVAPTRRTDSSRSSKRV